MAGMDWFRWHHGCVTDPKFQLIAKKAGASVAEVISVWACLLEEASQAENRGDPGEIDFEALDCLLGLEDGLARGIYVKMTDRGLFDEDGVIAAWDRRQPKREREDNTNAERQRAFRAKHAQVTPDNATVTPHNATDNQKTPRGEESRGEKKEEIARVAAHSIPGVSPELLADYLEVRKGKRAGKITRTVVAALERESKKAGISVEDAVKACCEFGWQGFNAQWYSDRVGKGGGSDPYGLKGAL